MDKTGATFALVLSDTSNETFELVAFDAMSGNILARHPLGRKLSELRFVDQGSALVGTYGNTGGIPNEADEYAVYWRWPDGAAQVIENTNPIRGLATSQDGSLFATVEGYLHEPDEDRGTGARRVGERRVRIWRGSDGEPLQTYPIDFNASRLAFSLDGRFLAVAGFYRIIVLRTQDASVAAQFKLSSGDLRNAIDLSERGLLTPHAPRAAFDHAGRLILMRAVGPLIYDLQTGEIVELSNQESVGNYARWTVNDDGTLLAVPSEKATTIFDLVRMRVVSSITGGKVSNPVFGGVSGRELFAMRDKQPVRLTWWPEELEAMACDRFYDLDWRRGRVRVTSNRGRHACDDSKRVSGDLIVKPPRKAD